MVRWVTHELRTLVFVGSYFAGFFFVVLLLKALLLEGYGIRFTAFSTALVLAFVTAKVVVVLDRAPLAHRVGLVEILARAGLYTMTAFVLLMLEKAFSSREAAGGLVPAIRTIFHHPDMPQILATVLCLAIAFAGYVVFAVARRRLGDPALAAAFLGRDRQEAALRAPRSS